MDVCFIQSATRVTTTLPQVRLWNLGEISTEWSNWEGGMMCFPSLPRTDGSRNVGEKHFSHLRNVIDRFQLHGLRCSKSFLQFLFVLNSCRVRSSNLKERVLKLSKSMHRNSEVPDMKFLFYLPFLSISFTLAGCCSWTAISASITCSHTHVSVKFESLRVINWASLVAQLTAMWETWVRSLGWEAPRRRKRLPTLVFWPGEFHGVTKSQTELFHSCH